MRDEIFPDKNPDANGYRLPTWVEWEFAASGGNQNRGYIYSGSDNLDEVEWCRDNSFGAVCDMWDVSGSRTI